jgi:hypothetical protein
MTNADLISHLLLKDAAVFAPVVTAQGSVHIQVSKDDIMEHLVSLDHDAAAPWFAVTEPEVPGAIILGVRK